MQRYVFSCAVLLIMLLPVAAGHAGEPVPQRHIAFRMAQMPPGQERTELLAGHGSLVVRTVPTEAEIEIPSLGVNTKKDRETWEMGNIPAGKHEVHVFAGGKVLRHWVEIEEHGATALLFDLASGLVTDMNAPAAPRERLLPEDFVPVKGGCFRMGDTFGGGQADERPVHEVCVDDFMLGRYELTQAQWEEVMGANPAKFKKGGLYPVENVSWNEVREFLRKLNAATGRFHRLPTEAEWEYACRSGGREEAYCGGAVPDSYAWHRQNSGARTWPVGQKEPNGLGIHDMSGNVWEWCQDPYEEKYYERSTKNNPRGPSQGLYRVIRGGSWGFPAHDARAANRDRRDPAYGFDGLGFRLVLPSQQR